MSRPRNETLVINNRGFFSRDVEFTLQEYDKMVINPNRTPSKIGRFKGTWRLQTSIRGNTCGGENKGCSTAFQVHDLVGFNKGEGTVRLFSMLLANYRYL